MIKQQPFNVDVIHTTFEKSGSMKTLQQLAYCNGLNNNENKKVAATIERPGTVNNSVNRFYPLYKIKVNNLLNYLLSPRNLPSNVSLLLERLCRLFI